MFELTDTKGDLYLSDNVTDVRGKERIHLGQKEFGPPFSLNITWDVIFAKFVKFTIQILLLLCAR